MLKGTKQLSQKEKGKKTILFDVRTDLGKDGNDRDLSGELHHLLDFSG